MSYELDALDPVAEHVTLRSGTVVALEPLKARQFFKLLRIITHGALPVMRDTEMLRLDNVENPGEFVTRLLSVMLLAIPDAETETLDFLQAMCKPAALVTGRNLNEDDTASNTALWDTLRAELDNPELDDMVTLIEAIVRREASDIQALGKRLSGMMQLAEKTGQLPQTRESSTATSSADSPELSISLRANTAGATRKSRTSASAGSDSASPRSASGASTSDTSRSSN